MTIKTGNANTDNGVILEVEPNHSWIGRVTLSATQTALNGGTVATPSVEIDTTVSGALPPDGTEVVKFCLAIPVLNLLGALQANTPVVETVYDVAMAVPSAATANSKLVLKFNGAGVALAQAYGDYV